MAHLCYSVGHCADRNFNCCCSSNIFYFTYSPKHCNDCVSLAIVIANL